MPDRNRHERASRPAQQPKDDDVERHRAQPAVPFARMPRHLAASSRQTYQGPAYRTSRSASLFPSIYPRAVFCVVSSSPALSLTRVFVAKL